MAWSCLDVALDKSSFNRILSRAMPLADHRESGNQWTSTDTTEKIQLCGLKRHMRVVCIISFYSNHLFGGFPFFWFHLDLGIFTLESKHIGKDVTYSSQSCLRPHCLGLHDLCHGAWYDSPFKDRAKISQSFLEKQEADDAFTKVRSQYERNCVKSIKLFRPKKKPT